MFEKRVACEGVEVLHDDPATLARQVFAYLGVGEASELDIRRACRRLGITLDLTALAALPGGRFRVR